MGDMSTVAQLISTLGFPIVMCGALFWKMNCQDKDHKEEMEKITTALNNNTEAIIKLTDHITGGN